MRYLLLPYLLIFLYSGVSLSDERTIDLVEFSGGAVGKHILYFQEDANHRLSFQEAKLRFDSGQYSLGNAHSISLGIGVDPVWMKLTVFNSAVKPLPYRLSIETPWLDFIDTWLLHSSEGIKHVSGGDGVAFNKRPMAYRVYAFETDFHSGTTELLIRVESKGPMALPVKLINADTAIQRDLATGYEYGFLYGLMIALALYNFLLYLVIRQREYGLYSLYLFGFVANSLSYTGQIYTIFTIDLGPYFQDWTDIFLMITYSIAGLHFARVLLDTKRYAFYLDTITKWTTIVIPTGMLIGALLNNLAWSMLLAFLLNSSFVILFVAMGLVALFNKVPSSGLFVVCSVTAAICITVSTLAVAGLVPYNDFTFKAIEVGMAFEAIFLALILARRFRTTQQEKIAAEKYAHTDHLTNLRNRRGFKSISDTIWQNTLRYGHNLSVVLIDIDWFKKLNDQYGHACGDYALEQISACLRKTARKADILARWGGEEFVVLLPETGINEAIFQCERMRERISSLRINYEDKKLQVTASIGVASYNDKNFGSEANKVTFEWLLKQADEALYEAKQQGRNQVIKADVSSGKTYQEILL